MSDQDKQREAFPDAGEGLAEIHERQKARGKDEAVELPPVRWETRIKGEVVDAGTLPQKEESPE